MREYISNRIDKLALEQGLVHEGLDYQEDEYLSTFLIQSSQEYQGLFLEVSSTTTEIVDYDDTSDRDRIVLHSDLESLSASQQLFVVKIRELLGCYKEANLILSEYHRRLENVYQDLVVCTEQIKDIKGELDNA